MICFQEKPVLHNKLFSDLVSRLIALYMVIETPQQNLKVITHDDSNSSKGKLYVF